jgi:hypothetical protein
MWKEADREMLSTKLNSCSMVTKEVASVSKLRSKCPLILFQKNKTVAQIEEIKCRGLSVY